MRTVLTTLMKTRSSTNSSERQHCSRIPLMPWTFYWGYTRRLTMYLVGYAQLNRDSLVAAESGVGKTIEPSETIGLRLRQWLAHCNDPSYDFIGSSIVSRHQRRAVRTTFTCTSVFATLRP